MSSGLLAVLLLAAGAAAAPPPDPGRQYYFEEIFSPFFSRDGGTLRPTRRGASSRSLPEKKAPGALRVFGVGGSIGGRYFASLEEDLSRALSTRTLEAANLGMAGYDSAREAIIVDEILDYEPDLIVLATGHNENNAVWRPPVPLWIIRTRDRLPWLKEFERLLAEFKPQSGGGFEAQKRLAALRAESLERNLREMLRMAKRRKVPVAVLIPPLNYRDLPPEDKLAQRSPAFIAGRVAYLRGDWDAAIAAWTAQLRDERLAERGEDAIVLWHAARAEDRAGRVEKAGEGYDGAMRAAFDEAFCEPRCQELLRRVSREEGAIVVDLDAAFRAAAAPARPGLETFVDGYHWSSRWNAPASAALADALRARAPFSSLSWDAGGIEALRAERRQRGTQTADEETLSTLAYAAQSAESVPPNLPMRRRAVVFAARVMEREPAWFGKPDKLAKRLVEAQRGKGSAWGMHGLAVGPARLRWLLGEAQLELGRPAEAARTLAAAVELDPALSSALLSLGAARALAGDAKGARTALDKASESGLRAEAAAYRISLQL